MSGGVTVGGYRRPATAAAAVRLDLNEAPRAPVELFRQRLLDRLAARDWHRYPDLDAEAARRAAASLYGWEPEGTLVGNGSNDLLAAALRALVPRGGTLAVLSPSFSMYPVLAARTHAHLAEVTLAPPQFEVPAAKLRETAARADVVVLASPNNPTGGLVSDELLAELAASARALIWDAAYVEFAGVEATTPLRRGARVIVLRSLSKAWGLAGLRVGALLAPPELAEKVRSELLPYGTGWLVTAAYETAAELRAEGGALVAEVVAERERLHAALAVLPGVEVAPSRANFLLVRRVGMSGPALAAALAAAGIAVREVEALADAGWVRASIGLPAENRALAAALKEVSGG